jgi:hypothetical protein
MADLWPIFGQIWDQFWANFEADFGTNLEADFEADFRFIMGPISGRFRWLIFRPSQGLYGAT